MDDDEEDFSEEIEEEKIEESVVPEQEVLKLPPPLLEVLPGVELRFKCLAIKELMGIVMKEQLLGRAYRDDQVNKWVKQIANGVRYKVTELNMKRYKVIVNVILLEMKGAGLKSGMRCLWDPNTDNYVSEEFRSDTMFCHTTCFGVYLY